MTYYEKIVNVQTGEEILREYTSEEIELVEKAEAESVKATEELQAKAAARLVILEKLGLTEDEAKVLLG